MSIRTLCALFLCGCSAAGGTGAEERAIAVTPGPGSGCSKAPDCGGCGTCAERCYCEHQDTAYCADSCQSPPGPTGTVPTPLPTSAPTGPGPTPTAMPTTMPTAVPTTMP